MLPSRGDGDAPFHLSSGSGAVECGYWPHLSVFVGALVVVTRGWPLLLRFTHRLYTYQHIRGAARAPSRTLYV